MKVHVWFFKNVWIFVFLLFVISGCRQHDDLPVWDGKQRIKNHFNHEKYHGLVEVSKVRFLDNQLDSLYGSEFMDMLYEVTLDVKESYVVSRLFLPGGFDVNTSWSETRMARLNEATDDETKQQIVDLYNYRTFTAGKHQFKSLVTYGKINDQWVFVEMSMDASP